MASTVLPPIINSPLEESVNMTKVIQLNYIVVNNSRGCPLIQLKLSFSEFYMTDIIFIILIYIPFLGVAHIVPYSQPATSQLVDSRTVHRISDPTDIVLLAKQV